MPEKFGFESTSNKEREQKPLFKLTLIRHERTDYVGKDPGLTEEGFESGKKVGEEMVATGILSEDEELYLLHSPQLRTKQTLESVLEGAGVEGSSRAIKQIRTSDKGPNYSEFSGRAEAIVEAQGGQLDSKTFEALAKEQHINPFYNTRPDVVETNDHKKERLYRSMEYLLRWFKKKTDGSKKHHILAVSHIEILKNIIDDVFGIESFDRYNVPSFGEYLEVEAFTTDDEAKVRLLVTFQDKKKEVIFNRKERLIEELDR